MSLFIYFLILWRRNFLQSFMVFLTIFQEIIKLGSFGWFNYTLTLVTSSTRMNIPNMLILAYMLTFGNFGRRKFVLWWKMIIVNILNHFKLSPQFYLKFSWYITQKVLVDFVQTSIICTFSLMIMFYCNDLFIWQWLWLCDLLGQEDSHTIPNLIEIS